MSELGQYAARFTDWRKTLATVPQAARYGVFERAVADVASLIPRGLNRGDAADELTEIAIAHGFDPDDVQMVISDIFQTVRDAPPSREEEPEQQQKNGHDKQAKASIPHATLYIIPDPATIPARDWLYGGHYVRGVCTATVAPGGFGKTTLTLYELISMALTGHRVWYISGEDPKVEIDRRIAAHLQHQDEVNRNRGEPPVDRVVIASNLFVDDKTSFPLTLGKSPRTSTVTFAESWLKLFESEIRENDIAVVALDPFVSFHEVPEGDNGAIDKIVKRLGVIASNTRSDIELSHHVRKPIQGAQADLTVDDSRGGSAIINAVRSARVFNRMSADEATLAKVKPDNRASYIRVDKGKRNMAPPEKATWWHIVSVPLPNGDNVQAIEPYRFPDSSEGLSIADVEWVQKFLREGGPRRAASQSPDWLGHHLGTRCGRDDTHEKSGAMWANKIIGHWIANKVFKRVYMRDPDSRKPNVPFYADNNFEVPSAGVVLPFKRSEEDS